MNALEVRYHLYSFLAGLARPAAIISAELIPPTSGEPVEIRVVTRDPMGEERAYAVSVREE
ncbi:hypothetical protein [Streptomyces sp. NRRL F-5123]|uniref:hypothetical protein n=1 Tax=Streptomyces sp. NRRL F-5123 TaxID=1463856 RepID=UPI0004E1C690|nr:hypothetical protein [Streptomyces sp. NRRL F-5123]